MNSLHLVDPELAPLLDAFPTLRFSVDLLPIIRSRAYPIVSDPHVQEQVAMEVHVIPGPAGAPDVSVRLYKPKIATGILPCILHMHGGGFVTGSAAIMDPAHRALSLAVNCIVVSVDYRLAPEVPFPGATEDCYAFLAWLFKQATQLGIDPRRVGVMGESAGGGLAAALALLVRDRKEYCLAFQHLIYPMLDDRTCLAAPHPYAGEFIWTPHNNYFAWASYLGHSPGSADVSMCAAPARAADLSALPPTYLAAGALDLFLEENMEFARRLVRHGVPVEMHIYPGAYHGFTMAPDARVAADAQRDSRGALHRALHTSP